jgi:class 3 adenylate cyclase
MSVEVEAASPLERYVPRIATDWSDDAPGKSWQELDATLCFVDISGFTNLSEKLARKGRIGAEELTGVLNFVFGRMLELAYLQGGSLLKFGGDALSRNQHGYLARKSSAVSLGGGSG